MELLIHRPPAVSSKKKEGEKTEELEQSEFSREAKQGPLEAGEERQKSREKSDLRQRQQQHHKNKRKWQQQHFKYKRGKLEKCKQKRKPLETKRKHSRFTSRQWSRSQRGQQRNTRLT